MSLERAEAAISDDEKEIGVVVLDIANPMSHLWLYDGGHLKLADVLPCGPIVGADAGRALDELFEHVADLLRGLPRGSPCAGIVLVGRAAVEVEGSVETAEKALAIPARLGAPVVVPRAPFRLH